jgi:hypothetical protein
MLAGKRKAGPPGSDAVWLVWRYEGDSNLMDMMEAKVGVWVWVSGGGRVVTSFTGFAAVLAVMGTTMTAVGCLGSAFI